MSIVLASHADRAKAALIEAARPDLVEHVDENRAGHACFRKLGPHPEADLRLIFRAFKLTHIDEMCPTAGTDDHGHYGLEDQAIAEWRESGFLA